jgi:hypothetical protein
MASFYKGTKQQCEVYKAFVNQETNMANGDTWAEPQELTDGSWAIFKHGGFTSNILEEVEDPEFLNNG